MRVCLECNRRSTNALDDDDDDDGDDDGRAISDIGALFSAIKLN